MNLVVGKLPYLWEINNEKALLPFSNGHLSSCCKLSSRTFNQAREQATTKRTQRYEAVGRVEEKKEIGIKQRGGKVNER